MSWITKNVDKDVANYLFNIKISSLPERIGLVQRDVRPDLTVDFELLEKQLEETPEMLAFWDLLLAEQKTKVAVLERQLLTARGTVVKRILEDNRASGVALRRSDLADIVETDDQILDCEARLIYEQRIESRLKCVVISIQSKAEVLRSLAGFKRQEQSEVRS